MKIIGRREANENASRHGDRQAVTIVEVSDKELALFKELSADNGIDQLRDWARSLARDLADRLGLALVERPKVMESLSAEGRAQFEKTGVIPSAVNAIDGDS